MNRVIAAFKKVRLRQILMTFLAGVLLFVSTACNSAGAKTGVGSNRQDVPSGLQSEKGAPASNNPRPEVPGGTATSPSRDVINSFQGGSMNEFSDVDPRNKRSEGTTGTSAQELIENAKRRIDQPGNAGDKIKRSVGDVPEGLKQGAEDVKNKAQDTADNLGKAAKQGVENAKDTTMNATRDATRGVNRSAEDVKDTTRGAFNRSVNRTADAAKDAVN